MKCLCLLCVCVCENDISIHSTTDLSMCDCPVGGFQHEESCCGPSFSSPATLDDVGQRFFVRGLYARTIIER